MSIVSLLGNDSINKRAIAKQRLDNIARMKEVVSSVRSVPWASDPRTILVGTVSSNWIINQSVESCN